MKEKKNYPTVKHTMCECQTGAIIMRRGAGGGGGEGGGGGGWKNWAHIE